MQLILITCASDQHVGFRLAYRYVARCRQQLSPEMEVAWIVADDGRHPVECPAIEGVASIHFRRPPSDGLESFRGNMRDAVASAQHLAGKREDSLIAVIEDDWLSPHYLADAVRAFTADPGLMLFGETRTRYYRIDNRRWHVFGPNGRAALSGTVMRAPVLPILSAWATGRDRTIMLDDRVWKSPTLPAESKLLLPQSCYVVGIKGLPGKGGLGMGCRMDGHRYGHDGDGSLLRSWIGAEDAAVYDRIIATGSEAA